MVVCRAIFMHLPLRNGFAVVLATSLLRSMSAKKHLEELLKNLTEVTEEPAPSECPGQRLRGETSKQKLAAAEQRCTNLEAELQAKSALVQRLEAREVDHASSTQQHDLRILMLETKLRVLLECYQHLEATSTLGTGPQSQQCHLLLQGPCGKENVSLDCSTSALAPLPGSHLALANRCAELEYSLNQQQQGHSALLSEKTKLQAEVERLQSVVAIQEQQLKLLAQQQQQLALHKQHMLPGVTAAAALGESSSVPPHITQRLQDAEEQLRQAQALGIELQQQLRAKDKALQAAEAVNERLCQDIKLMLGARDAIKALKSTLQQAVS